MSMGFFKQLSEKLEAQQIYDGLKGKYETRFDVNGLTYAFLATSIGGDKDDNTQWMLEFENIKSHRIGAGDGDKKVVKAFAEAVKQWADEIQPYCFYTYGSHLESLTSILEAVKKKIKGYNLIDYTADQKDEATGQTIDGNPVGMIKWTRMVEDEVISSEEKANTKNSEFETPYEEPKDIKPNKEYMSGTKKTDKLDKGDKSYDLKTEGDDIVAKYVKKFKDKMKGSSQSTAIGWVDGIGGISKEKKNEIKKKLGLPVKKEESFAEFKARKLNEKTNQPDYKFYVVGKNKKDENKIESGWEYKEDAQDQINELKETGITGVKVLQVTGLKKLGLDPDNDSDWGNLYR
jgi:hypothetical protein